MGISSMVGFRNQIDGPLVHTAKDILMLSGVTEAVSAAVNSID